MWIVDIFKKKKHKNTKSPKEEAAERLQTMLTRRREFVQRIPIEEFQANSEEIKYAVIETISRRFNIPPEKVRVDYHEQNGYVVIVTNVNFK
ncbi:MAG: trigger factor [Fervidobacterium sp.]|uniref:Cell division topological specificity factor n=1 Tax=Fervidobacterium gondwanense DSM 13020 TaxID=1121883 RepID=A0A1M7RW57_FERGO|nr:trigger factor [Fervidobacterium gondwanense]UXF00045.1 trigger factor [Fervidobacterium riparium]SHN50539.1 cell division topological specificity factor [Fervidobacterium gondwanense DSM 13020]